MTCAYMCVGSRFGWGAGDTACSLAVEAVQLLRGDLTEGKEAKAESKTDESTSRGAHTRCRADPDPGTAVPRGMDTDAKRLAVVLGTEQDPEQEAHGPADPIPKPLAQASCPTASRSASAGTAWPATAAALPVVDADAASSFELGGTAQAVAQAEPTVRLAECRTVPPQTAAATVASSSRHLGSAGPGVGLQDTGGCSPSVPLTALSLLSGSHLAVVERLHSVSELVDSIRIECIPGGDLSESRVVHGVMLRLDVMDPTSMPRCVLNPKIALLSCDLEYRRGDSETHLELRGPQGHGEALAEEDAVVDRQCAKLHAVGVTVVLTQRFVSDRAAHQLARRGVAVVRRVNAPDALRLQALTGARILGDLEDVRPSDLGSRCPLFEVCRVGAELCTFVHGPPGQLGACTILLRGGTALLLKELKQNTMNALRMVCNLLDDPRIVPGGGAAELAVGAALYQAGEEAGSLGKTGKTGKVEQPEQPERTWASRPICQPLLRVLAPCWDVVASTLLQNTGASDVHRFRVLTGLAARHVTESVAQDEKVASSGSWGVDGRRAVAANMHDLGIVDSHRVKVHVFLAALETVCQLVCMDDILAGKRVATSAAAR